MKNVLYTAILSASFLAATFAACAADEPAPKPVQTRQVASGLPFRGKISAIDKTLRTLSLAGKEKTRTYQITEGTKIKKDGKPATIEDLMVGEAVGGYALRNNGSSGHPEVVTLNLGKRGAPADLAEPEDSKDEKK